MNPATISSYMEEENLMTKVIGKSNVMLSLFEPELVFIPSTQLMSFYQLQYCTPHHPLIHPIIHKHQPSLVLFCVAVPIICIVFIKR